MKILFPLIVTMFLISCSNDAQKASTKERVQELKKSSSEVVTIVPQKRVEVAKEVEKPVIAVEQTIDGAKLFAKCVGCHGGHGERKALGKSQLIQGWSEEKVVSALNGYKDGSYGSSMKGVMQSQISKLSNAEIHAVAKHISGL